MKQAILRLSAAALTLFVLLPGEGVLAAPPNQGGQPEPLSPQIILVIDLSGSMTAHLMPEEVPAEIAALRDQQAAILASPDMLYYDQLAANLLAREDVIASQAALDTARAALDSFLADRGYESLDEMAAGLIETTTAWGCDPTQMQWVAIASTVDELASRAQGVCGNALTAEQLDALHGMAAYVDDPAWPAVRTAYADALTAHTNLLTNLGYTRIPDQREFLRQNLGYYTLADQIEALAETQGYPTRLEAAQSAARTLLDISELDGLASGRVTRIGVVSFSDTALLLSPLTTDYSVLDTVLVNLTPGGASNLGHGLQVALDELAASSDPARPGLIILLTDGHADRGLTPQQVAARLGPRLTAAGVRVCAVGLAADETEIDAVPLNALADVTGGEYHFAVSAQQAADSFVLCRQRLLAGVIQQFTGTVSEGQTAAAGSFTVAPPADGQGVVELTVTLNTSASAQMLVLTGPQGDPVGAEYQGAVIRQSGGAAQITITNPDPGEWQVGVSAAGVPSGGASYNVVVTMTSGERAVSAPGLPSFLAQIGIGTVACACVGGLVVIVAVVGVVVVRRGRAAQSAHAALWAEDRPDDQMTMMGSMRQSDVVDVVAAKKMTTMGDQWGTKPLSPDVPGSDVTTPNPLRPHESAGTKTSDAEDQAGDSG